MPCDCRGPGEPAAHHVVVRASQEVGYEVVAVGGGAAGLDAATSAGVPYDLVVTNSYMPMMIGEQPIGHLHELFPGLSILHIRRSVTPPRSTCREGTNAVQPLQHCSTDRSSGAGTTGKDSAGATPTPVPARLLISPSR